MAWKTQMIGNVMSNVPKITGKINQMALLASDPSIAAFIFKYLSGKVLS